VPIPESNHVIVCGYNEVGKEVISNLRMYDIKCAVVEDNPALVRELLADEIPCVIGDPTSETTLKKANIGTAVALIAVEDDSTNAFIALTASRLRDNLRIVTSAQEVSNTMILERAGATMVVAPKSIVGALLAKQTVTNLRVDDVANPPFLGNLSVGNYHIGQGSKVISKPLKKLGLSEIGAIVIGVWRDGRFHPSPNPWVLKEGDILLVLGNEHQLQLIRGMLQ
jgi:Trk K+ transport system NAD-binding subunit